MAGQVLRTTQVAELVGFSRQHVADLADRGDLRSWKAGTHRRFLLSDVVRYARTNGDHALELPIDSLNLTDRRSLAYGLLIAAKLVARPDHVMAMARANLSRLEAIHGDGPAAGYLRRWQELLDGPIGHILRVLAATDEASIDLRHAGPFAGVLAEGERLAIITATDGCVKQSERAHHTVRREMSPQREVGASSLAVRDRIPRELA